ncbi:unnamed protein product, partial [Urochloa humidicola]
SSPLNWISVDQAVRSFCHESHNENAGVLPKAPSAKQGEGDEVPRSCKSEIVRNAKIKFCANSK